MHVVTTFKPTATSKGVEEDIKKKLAAIQMADIQTLQNEPGSLHPRKEVVLAKARQLIETKFQAQPHIWTGWYNVLAARKKTVWAELEGGLGVSAGFYQNNLQYKSLVEAAIAKHLVSDSATVIPQDVSLLT